MSETYGTASVAELAQQAVEGAGDPNAEVIAHLSVTRNVAAVLAIFAEGALKRVNSTTNRIKGQVSSIFNDYSKATQIDDIIPVRTYSYLNPALNENADTPLQTNLANGHAIFYSWQVEKTLPRTLLVLADMLYENAASDPLLGQALDEIAAKTWGQIVRDEEDQMGRSLTAHDTAIHDAAAELQQFATEHGHISDEVLHKFGKVLGVAEHAATGAIFGGPLVAAEVHKFASALRESAGQATEFFGACTNNLADLLLGTTRFTKEDNTVWLNGAISTLGRQHGLPEDTDWMTLGRALAVRAITRRPAEITSPENADPSQRATVTLAGIASILDYNQTLEYSLTRALVAEHVPTNEPEADATLSDTAPHPND